MESKRFADLKNAFNGGLTLPLKYRKEQLSKLLRYLKDHAAGLIEAMVTDFMIPSGAELELNQTIYKVEEALGSIKEWIKDRGVGTGYSLMNMLDKATVHYDPKGIVLIIGAWNAPLALIIEPLIGAIAAGCCAVVKPSEIAPNTANFLHQTLPLYLEYNSFDIVLGGAEVTEGLIKNYDWDLIFYTGSQKVGQMVYEMAATRLIPVVLELGGKSPVIVLNQTQEKLQLAADRIIWGKMIKGGQICVAPDYVLVEDGVFDTFVGFLINSINRMFGDGKCPDIDLIINSRHWHRLNGLLENCGGSVVYEGPRTKEEKFFGPVIVTEPNLQTALMSEEIFGPILPVLRVRNVEEAIEFVNSRAKPLILYLFSEKKKAIDQVKLRTRSGGFCVNDTILSYLGNPALHQYSLCILIVDGLPFGGVGSSGIGSYHGLYSFETFSHSKACLERPLALGMVDRLTRFPPYNRSKVGRLNWVMFRAPRVIKGLTYIFLFAFILATGTGMLCWFYWHNLEKKH